MLSFPFCFWIASLAGSSHGPASGQKALSSPCPNRKVVGFGNPSSLRRLFGLIRRSIWGLGKVSGKLPRHGAAIEGKPMAIWWFQIFFEIFTPIWGEDSQFDELIFHMGWFNHQLEWILSKGRKKCDIADSHPAMLWPQFLWRRSHGHGGFFEEYPYHPCLVDLPTIWWDFYIFLW